METNEIQVFGGEHRKEGLTENLCEFLWRREVEKSVAKPFDTLIKDISRIHVFIIYLFIKFIKPRKLQGHEYPPSQRIGHKNKINPADLFQDQKIN